MRAPGTDSEFQPTPELAIQWFQASTLMGFVVAMRVYLNPEHTLVPGSLLSLQASLLHVRLNIITI